MIHFRCTPIEIDLPNYWISSASKVEDFNWFYLFLVSVRKFLFVSSYPRCGNEILYYIYNQGLDTRNENLFFFTYNLDDGTCIFSIIVVLVTVQHMETHGIAIRIYYHEFPSGYLRELIMAFYFYVLDCYSPLSVTCTWWRVLKLL